jgi:hypothetical protein
MLTYILSSSKFVEQFAIINTSTEINTFVPGVITASRSWGNLV